MCNARHAWPCSTKKMLSKQQTYESFNFAHIYSVHDFITLQLGIRCSVAATLRYIWQQWQKPELQQINVQHEKLGSKWKWRSTQWGKKEKISSSASQRFEYGSAFSRVYFIIFQQIFCRVQQTSVIVLLQQISAVVPSLSVNVTNVLLSFLVPHIYVSAEPAAICW